MTIRYTVDVGTVIARGAAGCVMKDGPIVDGPNKLFI